MFVQLQKLQTKFTTAVTYWCHDCNICAANRIRNALWLRAYIGKTIRRVRRANVAKSR